MAEVWRYTIGFQDEASRTAFEKTLVGMPQYTIIDKDRQSKEQTWEWEEELSRLKDLIDSSKLAWEANDPTSVNGFRRIYMQTNSIWRESKQLNIDQFVKETLEAFQMTYDRYSLESEKSVFLNRGRSGDGTVYRKLGGAPLTPRGLRILIKGTGLNGMVETASEIAAAEGLSSGLQQPRYIALTHLGWYLKSPLTPQSNSHF